MLRLELFQIMNFNSHPHEEDDVDYSLDEITNRCISTHILTKRMTMYFYPIQTLQVYFNSHPHEEDDSFCRIQNYTKMYFNSHPHEEDDHIYPVYPVGAYISTHILTKRMTLITNLATGSEIFQLTSSRRG